MPAEVRRATTDDADEISAIIAELVALQESVTFQNPMSTDEVKAWMRRQGEDGAMFVVDDGRFILGFAALDFDSATPNECSFGSWVRPANRRQGHGTALAEEGLAFARERGYVRVRGRLPQNNEAALSYLSSIGALVPLTNPGMSFELPIYDED
ncbi:MAG: GNAT family N-acetyltransferase [Dehalococcoidia bacterium]|nr:GNAT family N-acetyltransferase [Dehalococcoidia bacterium]